MEDNTFYVRNWRPNRIVFKYTGLKYILERRGSREDTTALPLDAKSDPVIARWMKIGVLEEISRDNFVELASRVKDGPFGALTSKARQVDIPIEKGTEPRPTTISYDLIDSEEWKREYLSPSINFTTPPLSTEEELAKLRAEAEVEELEEVAAPKTTKKKVEKTVNI